MPRTSPLALLVRPPGGAIGCPERKKGRATAKQTEGGFQPIRRRGVQRLSGENWGSGQSIWSADAADRDLVVDQIEVGEAEATEPVARVLGLEPGAAVCTRRRRFVLDGKPVLVSLSCLPADLVAGSPIVQEDTGPGGTYARLAELGYKPVHFREQVRSRMPSTAEARQLELSAGTPVIQICRTAFDGTGRAVEFNEMSSTRRRTCWSTTSTLRPPPPGPPTPAHSSV